MSKTILFLIILAILSLGSTQLLAQADDAPFPDFYEEPGLNPNRAQLNDHASEYIDPFSGTLHLSNTDIFIPGNGGLDLKLVRSYTSLQDYKLNWENTACNRQSESAVICRCLGNWSPLYKGVVFI